MDDRGPLAIIHACWNVFLGMTQALIAAFFFPDPKCSKRIDLRAGSQTKRPLPPVPFTLKVFKVLLIPQASERGEGRSLITLCLGCEQNLLQIASSLVGADRRVSNNNNNNFGLIKFYTIPLHTSVCYTL
jgi:hypothetical protein